VPGSVTTENSPTGKGIETWGDRVAKGTDLVTDGLEATRVRRER
jgi:hypothetical protein